MIVDFYSHILPGIDDGAKDIAMAREMLRIEENSGVEVIVATPHFYGNTAQRPPNGFAHALLAFFPSYCTQTP